MDDIAKIFHLAGWETVKSNDAEAAVARVEERIGRKLPQSFRSLLLCDNWVELLAEHSNCDSPISCSELGQRIRCWKDYDPLSDDLLPFMIENQGVCTWAVRLTDADDPPVVIEVDSGSPPQWQLTAPTFTQWLSCQVEDKRMLEAASFAAQAPGLDDSALAFIRRNFSEGKRTFAWPGETNYRFSNDRSQLLLWNSEGFACDWWISLARDAGVNEAIDELAVIPGLAHALYSICDKHSEELQAWKRQSDSGA
jgi:SMI1-KNR4 cell-wall